MNSASIPNGPTKSDSTWVHEIFQGTLTNETLCLNCETVSKNIGYFFCYYRLLCSYIFRLFPIFSYVFKLFFMSNYYFKQTHYNVKIYLCKKKIKCLSQTWLNNQHLNKMKIATQLNFQYILGRGGCINILFILITKIL